MYVGLWVVDGFPLLLVAVGILTHICYASLLSTFPVISLFSPGFIAGTCTKSVVYNVHVYIISIIMYCFLSTMCRLCLNQLSSVNVCIYVYRCVSYHTPVFLIVGHYLAFQYFATVWHPFQEVCTCTYLMIMCCAAFPCVHDRISMAWIIALYAGVSILLLWPVDGPVCLLYFPVGQRPSSPHHGWTGPG